MRFLSLFKKAKPEVEVRFPLPFRWTEYWRSLSFNIEAFDDPKVYQPKLAMMSFGLALSSFTSMDLQKNGGANAISYLEQARFTKIYASEDYAHQATSSSLGFVFGARKIKKGKKKFLLVAVGIRGGRYGAEWGSNVLLGPTGPHEGFQLASEKLYAEFKSYLERIKAKGDIAVWACGYSRAGGVASLFADELSRGLGENGRTSRRYGKANLDLSRIYTYTFAAPRAGQVNSSCAACIHNVINPEDLVPRVPFASFGFVHYGQEHEFVLSIEKENEILSRLSSEGIEVLPPTFVPMMFDIRHVFNAEKRFKEDFSKTGGQKAFLDDTCALIQDRISREAYAKYIQEGLASVTSLIDEQSQAPYERFAAFMKAVFDGVSENYGTFSLLSKLTSEKTQWKSLLAPYVSKAIEKEPELEDEEEAILTAIAGLLHFLCPSAKDLLALYPTLREKENLAAILFAHEAVRYYMLLLGKE